MKISIKPNPTPESLSAIIESIAYQYKQGYQMGEPQDFKINGFDVHIDHEVATSDDVI